MSMIESVCNIRLLCFHVILYICAPLFPVSVCYKNVRSIDIGVCFGFCVCVSLSNPLYVSWSVSVWLFIIM